MASSLAAVIEFIRVFGQRELGIHVLILVRAGFRRRRARPGYRLDATGMLGSEDGESRVRAPHFGHTRREDEDRLADSGQRGSDERDGRLDLRWDPEGSAVGVELRRDEAAHLVAKP